MKSASRIIAGLVGVGMLIQLQACYGNFALTRKLYTWNGQLGDKWINSIATWVMIAIPVYGVVGFVDFALLNTIQFWTGSNPVAMDVNDKDVQMVQYGGKNYQLTATKNRLEVREIVDGKAQSPVSLVYDEKTKIWSAQSNSHNQPLIEMIEGPGQIANLIYPDGHKERVQMAAN